METPSVDPKVTTPVQDLLDQQVATGTILRAIADSPTDIQPVLNIVAESAAKLCKAYDAVIYLQDGDFLALRAHYGPIPAETVKLPIERDWVTGQAFLDCCPTQVEDLQEAAEFPAGRDSARRQGFRTTLAVPLLRKKEAIGVLTVRRLEVQPFSQKQIDLLATFADQAVIAIENVRLSEEAQTRNRELSEALEQQTATSTILRAIAASPTDIRPVLESVVESAANLCDAYDAVVMMKDGDRLVTQAHHGPITVVIGEFPVDRNSVTGRAVVDRLPVQVADSTQMAEEFPVSYEIAVRTGQRTVLAVPLLRDEEAIGALSVRRIESHPFSDRQINLLSTFADQAVIAIENTRLFEEVQARTHELEVSSQELNESLHQQTATADVLKVISRSAFDLQMVLDTLTSSAAKLCDADMGSIARQKGEGFYYSTNYNLPPEMQEYINNKPLGPGRGSVTGRALLDRKVVQIADLLADPDHTFLDSAKTVWFRTLLGVPLMREGSPIGAIALARKNVKPFSQKQIELVQTFADQAVIAIENTRLFDEVQSRSVELSESLQQQTATADVLKAISRSTFDLQTVLDTLVESAAGLCGANVTQLFKLDGTVLRWVAGFALNPAYLEIQRDRVYPPGRDSMVGRVLLEKGIVQITDALADPEYGYKDHAKVGNTRTLLGVPLLRSGELTGVIVLARDRVEPFSEKQIDIVRTFADQAVIAIENARLFDEVRARTEELSESLQQQTATAEVLKTISRSTFDLKSVLQTLVESAAKLCDAEKAMITRQTGGEFYRAEAYGFSDQFMELVGNIPVEPERGSAQGRAMLEGKTVHIADVLADPEYTMRDAQRLGNFRTILGVPMLRDGEAIGVLALTRSEVRPFTDKQIELVSTFADQAAIAIENVRLFDEVQARTRELEASSQELSESLQQQTATAEVLKTISRSTFDLKSVLQTLVESAARLCDTNVANITRQIDGLFFRSEFYGASPEFIERVRSTPVVPDRGSAQGRALLEGKIVHIADVAADPEYTFDAGKLDGVRTVLGVPMMREGVPIGAMALARFEVRPFTDKQIELISTFADQAAIAIENVRLFESVEARTRELAKSLEDLRSTQDRLIQTQKLASLGQLTAGIAHEIKNPLNFVNNFATISVELLDEIKESLDDPNDDQKRAELGKLMALLSTNLMKIGEHGRRADSIVKNMLLHSRQGSGESRLANINSILEESLNLAYHGARAERQGFDITLEKALDAEAGDVELFPQEITRVFLNLISNGFYATAQRNLESRTARYEPTLAVKTINLGDRVEIKIRDNGTGMPTEIRDKIFNPFFTTKPPGEGTGLGLSLSYDIIVKQHGGSIDVESQQGEFTEFTIILPRNIASSSAGVQ